MNDSTKNTETPEPHTPAQETPAQETPAQETPTTEAQATTDPPEGTTTAATLFDMTSPAEKKKKEEQKRELERKKRAEESRKQAQNGAGRQSAPKPAPEKPTVYDTGVSVRYLGHTMTLEKPMTAAEVLAWISEDDFPELAHEDGVELRFDKEKNRLVPVRKAQKKGL